MKRYQFALAITLLAALVSGPAMAASTEKHVIAIKTDDFELMETDVSDLAIGEAETIVTESGKTVDILRTAEGMEIYVDGELLDIPLGDANSAHRLHRRVVVDCDSAQGDCEHQHDGELHKVMVKDVHVECTSEDDSECIDQQVWVTDGGHLSPGEVNIEELVESGDHVTIMKGHARDHDEDFDIHLEDGERHEVHEVIVVREIIEEES